MKISIFKHISISNIVAASLIAVLPIVVSSCQKEEDLVNLTAIIAERPDSGAKLYINNFHGCWQNGDLVNVNNEQCTLSVTGTSSFTATIPNVAQNNVNGYTAVYPASCVKDGLALNGGVVSITIPDTQYYRTVQNTSSDGSSSSQYLEMPMVAYCAPSASTLKFYNAASVIKLDIVNEKEAETLKVHYVTVTSAENNLSGTGSVDASSTTPSLVVSGSGSQTVTLDCCKLHPELATGETLTVYLVVAPFGRSDDKDKLTVNVLAENASKKKYTFTAHTPDYQLYINRNQIGAVTVKIKNTNGTVSDFWGRGKEDCPYLITSVDDLKQLRTVVNSDDPTDKSTYNTNQIHYLQTTNINLKNAEWGTTRIAKATSYSFSANYDGDGYSITNLPMALFGYAGAANSPNTIKNLTVSGGYTSTSGPCGGLVNQNYDNTHLNISNCTTAVNLKASGSLGPNVGFGGVVGCIYGSCKVEDCINTGNITTITNSNSHNTLTNFGGIVGLVTNEGSGSIEHCRNTGTIGSDPDVSYTSNNLSYQACCAGGIIGRVGVSSYKIISCNNEGEIRHSGNKDFCSCGGIVGRVAKKMNNETTVDDILIKNCTNESVGQVMAVGDGKGNGAGVNTALGGICGCIVGGSNHKIEGCQNKGYVFWQNTAQNQADIGGIIGKMGYNKSIAADIIDCANLHNIKGSGNVSSSIGGILGYSYSNDATAAVNIINCYNSHTVTGGARVGGIAGYSNKGGKSLQIFNCYNTGSVSTTVTGNVSNKACAGGIVGWSTVASSNGLATNCWSSGNITLYNAGSYNYKGTIAGYVKGGSDIVSCYGTEDNALGGSDNGGAAGYTKFTGFGTIGDVATALCTNLNSWVTTNNASDSNPVCLSWEQAKTAAGVPTELPHHVAPAAKR